MRAACTREKPLECRVGWACRELLFRSLTDGNCLPAKQCAGCWDVGGERNYSGLDRTFRGSHQQGL